MKLSSVKLYTHTNIYLCYICCEWSSKALSPVLKCLPLSSSEDNFVCVYVSVCLLRACSCCVCVCVRQRANRESWAVRGISCIITERLIEAGWILIEFCGVFHRLWSHGSKIRENFQAWCPSASRTLSHSFSRPPPFFSPPLLFPFFALSLFSHFELPFPILSFLLGFCLSLNPFLCLTLSVAFSPHSVSLWNLY